MGLEFALDPRDHEKYGGPEWLEFDAERLNDLPFSVTGPWDRELVKATDQGITQLLIRGLEGGTADGVTALMWLARKLADVETPDFAKFDVRWRKIRRRPTKPAVGDADPPPNGSSEPSSATGE